MANIATLFLVASSNKLPEVIIGAALPPGEIAVEIFTFPTELLQIFGINRNSSPLVFMDRLLPLMVFFENV